MLLSSVFQEGGNALQTLGREVFLLDLFIGFRRIFLPSFEGCLVLSPFADLLLGSCLGTITLFSDLLSEEFLGLTL